MRIWIFSILMAFTMTLSAQPAGRQGEHRFDPVKFQQMVEKSITKYAKLTSDEAKAFFPLYNEMRQKQRDLGKQIQDLKKQQCDKDCAKTILKIKRMQVEMWQLEESYYKRFLKIIPAEKLFKIMQAEDDFHRNMVRGQRGQNRNKNNNRRPQAPAPSVECGK